MCTQKEIMISTLMFFYPKIIKDYNYHNTGFLIVYEDPRQHITDKGIIFFKDINYLSKIKNIKTSFKLYLIQYNNIIHTAIIDSMDYFYTNSFSIINLVKPLDVNLV